MTITWIPLKNNLIEIKNYYSGLIPKKLINLVDEESFTNY